MTARALLRGLLIRGLLSGLLAGLLAVGFAELFGEPPLERAIGFETAQHTGHDHAAAAPEPVSRAVQRSWGLLVAGTVYGIGLGGLFALVFAALYGRFSRLSPRALALALAVGGLVAVVLVPQLKYPANPPSIGEAESIGLRTALYFELISVSLAVLGLAIVIAHRMTPQFGGWDAALIGALVYIVIVVGITTLLPKVKEIPDGFPADALWHFRIASWGMQGVLWLSLGIAFGAFAERLLAGRGAIVPRD